MAKVEMCGCACGGACDVAEAAEIGLKDFPVTWESEQGSRLLNVWSDVEELSNKNNNELSQIQRLPHGTK